MIIKTPTFLTSVADNRNLVKSDLPQIAISGKSNVGKSSFINMLTGRRKLAKTSSTPGRTRLINYFNIDEKFLLVDLPGFGYAKVAKTEKEKWGELIEGYILNEQKLKRIIHLVDCRHEPGDNDYMMVNFLYHNQIPFNIVLTKADKITRSAQLNQKKMIARSFKMTENDIILTSSETKQGKEEVLKLIESIISE